MYNDKKHGVTAMAHKPLHLKYRPRKLSELCGQNHIVKSFTNMVKKEQIPKSFLFQGQWGSGKTTTARIVAAMLNCEKGVTLEPCGECLACKKVVGGSSIDYREVNAADNRGIDDIRNLVEFSKFTPSELRYKIIILDECHMLTKAASDALLKLLEEPPGHMFIFMCTTDPQQLLDTIHSRCLRYSFKKITPSDIYNYLCKIAKAESLEYEDEALRVIARISNGSMRDSLKNLESLRHYSDGKLLENDAYEFFRVADSMFNFDLVDKIIQYNATEGLIMISDLVANGIDVKNVIKDFSKHLRDLLVTKTCKEDILHLSDSHVDKLKNQASQIKTTLLMKIIKLFEKASSNTVFNLNSQFLLETTFVESLILSQIDNNKAKR